jgi:micrococcal nuclease
MLPATEGLVRVPVETRKRRLGTPLILFLLATLGLRPTSAGFRAIPADDSVRGIVTYAYDGDTIKVRLVSGEEKRVRFIGVDSPEYNDPRLKFRFLAFFAKRFTHSELYQKSIRLSFDREREDVHGRLLAYVWTDGSTLFNEILVRSGFARAFLKFPYSRAMQKRMKEAEAEAREKCRGLWRKDPFPEIGSAEASSWSGQVASVRFLCARSYDRSHFRILAPAGSEFEVVIPEKTWAVVPGSGDLVGRVLTVTGLVETFMGRPQIMVGLSSQIRVAE